MRRSTRDAIRFTVLEELRTHGPSRGADLVLAIVEADGYEPGDVLECLTDLALAGHVDGCMVGQDAWWVLSATAPGPDEFARLS